MTRREIIPLLGGTAIAWPLKTRAQQQAVPVIGYFDFGRSSSFLEDAFRQGLAEAGYIEGRNVAIIYRSAGGNLTKCARWRLILWNVRCR